MNRAIALAGFALLAALPAFSLTLEEALQRGRQSAPAVVAARLRIDEARGRVTGAALRVTTNPTLDVEAGRRSGETSSTEYGLAVGQDLDLPRRRRARIDAANAIVAQEEQRARDAERQALLAIATTFLRALEARERADVAAGGEQLAGEALRIAERRYAAGDVAQLDVNLARTAVARAGAETRVAQASLAGYVVQLQVLLGTTEPVSVDGSLHNALVTGELAADRADLRVLDAEIAEAEAEQQLARTLRWPDFGVRASYAREEGDRIVLGGIGVTLPVFQRGQEAAAVAGARLARLRTEREALAQAVEAEVRGAAASVEALRAVASDYERTVLPLVDENERLALESYDVGQIGLGDLLLVRREALDARRSLIDQLIETRLAEVELRAKAGVWK